MNCSNRMQIQVIPRYGSLYVFDVRDSVKKWKFTGEKYTRRYVILISGRSRMNDFLNANKYVPCFFFNGESIIFFWKKNLSRFSVTTDEF